MNKESITLISIIFVPIVLTGIGLTLKLAIDMIHEKKWIISLGKERLYQLEGQLNDCLEKAHIYPDQHISIEDTIRQLGYNIKEKNFMWLKEAYTTKNPTPEVCIRKRLPHDRRHFALAHELMHIIYRPEELEVRALSRDTHMLFRSRDTSEQIRDYMAASLILRKDTFWQEVLDAKYFSIPPKERKIFIFETAKKYDVQPSTIFRRIDELAVMMN